MLTAFFTTEAVGLIMPFSVLFPAEATRFKRVRCLADQIGRVAHGQVRIPSGPSPQWV
jgi:hypothetical protein